jgi:hypothetical protein
METWQKRKFKPYKKHKRYSDFSTIIINEMYNTLQDIQENKIKEKAENTEDKKYVIISESII